jgi:hypothetical protein
VGANSWWADQLHETLSQGDVIGRLPIFVATKPTTFLKKATFKGDVSGWMNSEVPMPDGDKKVTFLGSGNIIPAIVLSHSCELDKDRKSGRVIVAPIFPITNVSEDQRDSILQQKHFALMPLPEIPELGTYFADFRSISTLHRDVVNEVQRIASMTELANQRLAAQIVAFFLRRELP